MLPVVASATIAAAVAWRDDFSAPAPSLFTKMHGLRHGNFVADDAMLEYNAPLGPGRRGLKTTTTDAPCKACSASCAHLLVPARHTSGADGGCSPCYAAATNTTSDACYRYTSQYLMSADPITKKGNYYRFGDYEISMRTGHRADGSPAEGTVTCWTPGTTPSHLDSDPLHNELALCFDGAHPTQAKFLYWYNQEAHLTIFDLGFNASAALHTYTVSWLPGSIAWGVDGRVVHTDVGIPGRTIPWEPTAMVVGLLMPRGMVGTSYMWVEHISYTPCAGCSVKAAAARPGVNAARAFPGGWGLAAAAAAAAAGAVAAVLRRPGRAGEGADAFTAAAQDRYGTCPVP